MKERVRSSKARLDKTSKKSHLEGAITVRLERRELLAVHLDVNILVLANLLDLVEDLGVAAGRVCMSGGERKAARRAGEHPRPPRPTEDRHEVKADSLARLKDVVKLLLERGRLAEGPVALLLVAEDDVLENGLGHAELRGDLFVDVGALGRQALAFLRDVARGTVSFRALACKRARGRKKIA